MTRSLQHIILVCLLTLGLLVQATFARADSVLCLGHLHPGSCTVASAEAIGDEDCCDHSESDAHTISIAVPHPDQGELPGCCCVDVQVSGQQSSVSQRMLLLKGFQKSSAVATAALIATCMPPRLMVSPAQQFRSPRATVPRNDLRLRTVILQI